MDDLDLFAMGDLHHQFKWENLGDIKTGRGNLGEEMPVIVYRLLQYTLLDVLSEEYGLDTANDHFRDAGHLAGKALAENILDLDVDLDTYVANLQQTLVDLKIGNLEVELFNPENGSMVLTIGEDLDCSGLADTQENVCMYDEGFIAGLLEAYTGNTYYVREVSCWASGDKVCRFSATVVDAAGE